MSMKNIDSDAGRKSSSYPYLPLHSCFRVSEAVRDLGGARSQIQKSLLARQLGESEKSGTFSQRITAVKCFGLIEGHGSYTLTELSKRYYFPTNESDKSAASLEIFSTPSCFRELIRRFDGDRLPTKEILANILHRDLGVPESWRDRVATYFIGGAQSLGLIDGQGILRFRAAQDSNVHEAVHAVDQPSAEVSPPKTSVEASPLVSKPGANVWSYSLNGKSVQIHTPEELDSRLWEKLNGYVQLLKPTDDF